MPTQSINIVTDLILNHSAYGEDETILFLSAEGIELIEAVAAIAQSVEVFDLHYSTLNRARHYTQADNVAYHESVFPNVENQYDTAVLIVPKGRDLARAQLWSALQATKQNSLTFIAGANKGGAKTMIKDAGKLFDDVNVLGYRKSHRVASAVKKSTPPYPDEWGDLPTQIQQRTFETPHGKIAVHTMPGVFSWEVLDDGTRFLLEHTSFEGYESVLDVGCGNGVIGMAAAKHACHVVMTDDNLLAVRCARATAEGHAHVNAFASNVYDDLGEATFDLIITNPPFHQQFDVSKATANRIIRDAADHLNPGGKLRMVANAFLKYEEPMQDYLSSVREIARNNKFKILEATR